MKAQFWEFKGFPLPVAVIKGSNDYKEKFRLN